MSDQPAVYRFRVLFESALQDYERQTGIALANHPLAEQLQTCQSAESVTALLQKQLLAFGGIRENDKIMGSLTNVVSVLSKISATAALCQDFGTVCPGRRLGVPGPQILNAYSMIIIQSFPPVDAIHTGLGVLLTVWASFHLRSYYPNVQVSQAFEGVTSDLKSAIELLESIESFLNRLDIYTKVPPTPAMTEIIVKILVELLSTLAVATKQIRQERPSESVFASMLHIAWLNAMQRNL